MKSEYFLLTVLDVMRDSTFELKFDTSDEICAAAWRYSNDSDYEVVSANRVLTEVKALRLRDLKK